MGAVCLGASLLARPAAASSDSGGAPPLLRRYREGETLKYRIDGTHSTNGKLDFDWRAHAAGTVVRDAKGVYAEKYEWTRLKWAGETVAHPAKDPAFRQSVSLDPAVAPAIPDLSQVDGRLIAPITDTLTFYSDYWVAIKHGVKLKAGDRVYSPFGKPASWADGDKVVTGYDCIDFDVTVAAVDPDGGSAVLRVRHVPPPAGCEKVPAEWMRAPVFDTANNWFEVTKEDDGRYRADVGKETFDAEIHILLPSGVIASATLFNPVDYSARYCKDAALADCGAPVEKGEIVRRIKFTREP